MKSDALSADARFLCASCWHVFADGGASACPDCAAAQPREGWPSPPYAFRGRYTLTARVGRDAASAIFHARSAGEGEPRVLLEVARTQGPLAATVARKLFRREATLAGLLGEESDAFLGLSSIDVTEPAYLAFEHVPWPALADVLAEAGTLAPAAAARVGVAILRGVAALERHELVHRALVPARIFVHLRHDGGYDVKIAGLGAWPDPEEGAPIPLSPEVLAYASPEQLHGDTLTSASDVHMVASILWELVTGEVPYPLLDRAPPAEAAAHRLRRLARVPARPAAMPVELHELLVTALHPDPTERWHEGSPVAGLGMALERFADELPRRQERALGATTRALGALTARLAPFAALLERKAAIEVTVARLAAEPGGPGAVRAAEEALADLEAEVDRLLAPDHVAAAVIAAQGPAAREPASIPPEVPPPPPQSPAFPLPSRRPPAELQIPKAPALPSDATQLLSGSMPPDSLEIPGVGGSRWPYVVGVLAVVALVLGGVVLSSGSKGTPAASGSASAPVAGSAPPVLQAAPAVPTAPSATAAPSASAPPSASAAPPARPKPRPQRARAPDGEPPAERPADPE